MSDEKSTEAVRSQQLAVELARDNPDALGDMLTELGPGLTSMLRRRYADILSEEDLEDVLSQTLLRVWLHRKDYRPDRASFPVWCFVIAKNAALDLIREKARRNSVLPQLWTELHATSNETLSRVMPPHPALADVQRLLKTFSPLDRRLLLASVDREGAWAAELASEFGVSANALRQRRFRAMARLRRALAQLGHS